MARAEPPDIKARPSPSIISRREGPLFMLLPARPADGGTNERNLTRHRSHGTGCAIPVEARSRHLLILRPLVLRIRIWTSTPMLRICACVARTKAGVAIQSNAQQHQRGERRPALGRPRECTDLGAEVERRGVRWPPRSWRHVGRPVRGPGETMHGQSMQACVCGGVWSGDAGQGLTIHYDIQGWWMGAG
jgi:hypothetical protein